jgi:hypothetical protein
MTANGVLQLLLYLVVLLLLAKPLGLDGARPSQAEDSSTNNSSVTRPSMCEASVLETVKATRNQVNARATRSSFAATP